jgi:hypothetical protein
MFKLVRSDSRCRPPDLRYADCILLASAARARTRIYAPTIPSDHGTLEPGASGRDCISAKPAPVCRGSTRASGWRHGPRAHCCEAEEGNTPPPESCSEESCFARRSGQDTDRNRRTNLEAVAPWPSAIPRWLARMLRDWHRRRAQRLSEAAEKQRRALEQLTERADHHEHRARHWDLVRWSASRMSGVRIADRGAANSQFGGEHLPVWIEPEQYRLVGACLAAARRRANLTQIRAAERLGRTQSFVSEIERGLRRVDVLEIILIARGLRANPLKLFAEITRSAGPA